MKQIKRQHKKIPVTPTELCKDGLDCSFPLFMSTNSLILIQFSPLTNICQFCRWPEGVGRHRSRRPAGQPLAAVQQQQPAALAEGLGQLRVCGEDSLGILLLAEVPAGNPPLSFAASNHWPLFSRRISKNVACLLLCCRKLWMYAPQEEQPKQSLNREEMTEVGAQSERTIDAKRKFKLQRAALLLL